MGTREANGRLAFDTLDRVLFFGFFCSLSRLETKAGVCGKPLRELKSSNFLFARRILVYRKAQRLMFNLQERLGEPLPNVLGHRDSTKLRPWQPLF